MDGPPNGSRKRPFDDDGCTGGQVDESGVITNSSRPMTEDVVKQIVSSATHDMKLQISSLQSRIDALENAGIDMDDFVNGWEDEEEEGDTSNNNIDPNQPLSMSDVPKELFGGRTKAYLPVKALRVIGGRQCGSSNPSELNDAEKDCLFGPGGYITEHCPVYALDSDGLKEGKRKKAYEYVTSYYCKGRSQGCQYKVKIMRIKGGLVVLQKVEIIEAHKIPISHNEHADCKHKTNKNTKDGASAGGLSVSQQKFIIHHFGMGNVEWLVEQMSKITGSRNSLCSQAQLLNKKSFVESVRSFICHNPRYFPNSVLKKKKKKQQKDEGVVENQDIHLLGHTAYIANQSGATANPEV